MFEKEKENMKKVGKFNVSGVRNNGENVNKRGIKMKGGNEYKKSIMGGGKRE